MNNLDQHILACRSNDRASQEHIYKEFYPKMMTMVRRYVEDRDTAEELLNSGFFKAFTQISSYAFKGSFEGWLRIIIRNTVFSYFRSKRFKEDQKVVGEPDHDIVISDHYVNNLEYKELLKMVHALPDATRAVFIMFIMEGMSHSEIASSLGITVGTSKWHLHNGRKMLKAQIENR